MFKSDTNLIYFTSEWLACVPRGAIVIACVIMLLIAVAIEKQDAFSTRIFVVAFDSDGLLVVSLNSLEGNHSLIPTIIQILAFPTFTRCIIDGKRLALWIIVITILPLAAPYTLNHP